MPKSQKPIIAIISSPNLKHIDLNRFIDFDHIGAVVSGGETSIDSIIEHGTKQYKKEGICYLPQEILYKESAIDHRNQDMINFCDFLMVFWDGKTSEILNAINYCKELNRPYICHFIQELD